ncbi:budding uninhibited by benzimidazole- protein [Cyanidiococcus yangmingshanensis]|uniref:Budding uninhibited by benzimidazole- protein n=1 Tax=Cyanidiococcus yangmingshanensis TaxID=2690220 RepID=A0A7J7IDV4_9RHOD|nr:budding uninhibited by benzimidazole- protein [Cyanidiococcus yangmingshanensis]
MSGNALERLSSETTDSARSVRLSDNNEGQDAVDKTPSVVVASMNNADGWLVALRRADAWALRQWLAQGRVLPHEASKLCNHLGVLQTSSLCEGVRPKAPGLGFPEELQTPRGAAWVLLAAAPDLAETLDHICESVFRYRQLLNKIEQDIPRTFQGAEEVRQRVSSEALVRVLSAAAVYNNNLYLQGMNLYAAAFLYVLPEPEAFNLLIRLIDVYAPRYFRVNTLAGAHEGCKLAAQLLQFVDAELANRLGEDPLGLERLLLVHGFPAILSLSLSIPPFEDALTLLDWILAFGAHFGVVFVVARLRCAREQLLRQSVSAKQVLNPRRSDEVFYIPPQAIVRESLALISQLSSEFWEQLRQASIR